jgi:hypothetical protein
MSWHLSVEETTAQLEQSETVSLAAVVGGSERYAVTRLVELASISKDEDKRVAFMITVLETNDGLEVRNEEHGKETGAEVISLPKPVAAGYSSVVLRKCMAWREINSAS